MPMKKTPIGLVPAFCYHEVPNDAEIVDHGAEIVISHPEIGNQVISKMAVSRCRQAIATLARSHLEKRAGALFPPSYDGWLAYTTFQYTAGIGNFIANFSVPTTSPAQVPEELYIFPGLQNVDWIPKVDPLPKVFDIIQPVLQYPAQSGSGWSVRSWYVTLDVGVIVSPEVHVSKGEVIYSYMNKIGAQKWQIAAKNSANQWAQIKVSAARLAKQPWAYNTIECYGCDSCQYEPTTPTHFTQLILTDENNKPITPTWVTHVSPKLKCQEHAVVISPSAVDLYFSN